LGKLEDVEEIFQRARQPAQLGEHHRVNPCQLDIPHHSLEGRAVRGLTADALVYVGLEKNSPVLALRIPSIQL